MAEPMSDRGQAPSVNTTRDYLVLPKSFTQITGGQRLLVDLWGREFHILYRRTTNQLIIWSLGD